MITSPHFLVWRIATHIPNMLYVTHTYGVSYLSVSVGYAAYVGFVTLSFVTAVFACAPTA